MTTSIKFLAYYLPQFHPIPENDLWWGKGFTEWTNVTKAKPLFKGHYQPILPADLGFYDLRVPEVQEAQSQLALEYGLDGFIYYQYWFGNGKMLLEKPAEAMLANKEIKIPFCFCWANETWKGIWHGLDNPDVLIEQTYNGEEGYIEYFNYLLAFFTDDRYLKIDNMPMFQIYKIDDIPDLDQFIATFNKLATLSGFNGIYFFTSNGNENKIIDNPYIYGRVASEGFQKIRYKTPFLFENFKYLGKVERKLKSIMGLTNGVGKRKSPLILDYKKGVKKFHLEINHNKFIPCVFPNWDNSARSGKKSLIFKNASPKLWQKHLDMTVKTLIQKPFNPQIVVIKSWNEWAEGNYIEPDLKFGHLWLQAIKNVKLKYKIL